MGHASVHAEGEPDATLSVTGETELDKPYCVSLAACNASASLLP